MPTWIIFNILKRWTLGLNSPTCKQNRDIQIKNTSYKHNTKTPRQETFKEFKIINKKDQETNKKIEIWINKKWVKTDRQIYRQRDNQTESWIDTNTGRQRGGQGGQSDR